MCRKFSFIAEYEVSPKVMETSLWCVSRSVEIFGSVV